ncbi:conserved phage C-terminal domain-containing protein [Rosenbergiella epipactidis]|uniref:conserved phage C-terminal domain-containing protein n=1 Tax=Rosenbergiella epipactidis TaxID=1544694 RepID=UPI001F4F1329|nr:conserved phage C-terminal domain-containing protein [Rosenbergiella epipactidis]
MSVKLSSYVWDGCASAGMKLTSVAIMARLADFSNDEGVCWPSTETIARQLGAGESTIRSAIGKLEQEGWLTRQQRRSGNRNASNIYRLNVAKLRKAALSHESDSDPSKSDASRFDGSKSDASESSKKQEFHPPESGGDPSVTSKQEPSVKSKPLCQVAGQPDPEVVLTEQARDVLTHLNQTTGSRFTTNKSSLEHIRARLREDFTVAELNLVVDYKTEDWRGTEQEQYLRPATLFIPKNFAGYLQKAGKWDQAGRPQRINGRWSKPGERVITEIDTPDQSTPAGFRGA